MLYFAYYSSTFLIAYAHSNNTCVANNSELLTSPHLRKTPEKSIRIIKLYIFASKRKLKIWNSRGSLSNFSAPLTQIFFLYFFNDVSVVDQPYKTGRVKDYRKILELARNGCFFLATYRCWNNKEVENKNWRKLFWIFKKN